MLWGERHFNAIRELRNKRKFIDRNRANVKFKKSYAETTSLPLSVNGNATLMTIIGKLWQPFFTPSTTTMPATHHQHHR